MIAIDDSWWCLFHSWWQWWKMMAIDDSWWCLLMGIEDYWCVHLLLQNWWWHVACENWGLVRAKRKDRELKSDHVRRVLVGKEIFHTCTTEYQTISCSLYYLNIIFQHTCSLRYLRYQSYQLNEAYTNTWTYQLTDGVKQSKYLKNSWPGSKHSRVIPKGVIQSQNVVSRLQALEFSHITWAKVTSPPTKCN